MKNDAIVSAKGNLSATIKLPRAGSFRQLISSTERWNRLIHLHGARTTTFSTNAVWLVQKVWHIDAVGYKFVRSIRDPKMEFLVNMRAADHDHDHDHQAVPSDPTLRVKALESLLVEKGLVDPAALDALIDTYEHKVGPRNGARVVARAWIDPAYKQRLLTDATAAIARTWLHRRAGRAHGRGREYAQGAQPGGLHAVLLLSLAGARACRRSGTSRRPTARAR